MRSDRNFVRMVGVASFVMVLIAGTLFVHALQTQRWLTEIKAQARARAERSVMAVPPTNEADRCPDSKPLLIGFDEAGHAKCRALSSQACGAGQYISSIDPLTLEIHCSDAGAEMSCPADHYITEFMWLGENHISYSCIARLNPFLAWKFEPSLSSKGSD